MKKFINIVRDIFVMIFGFFFIIVTAPVIYFTGLDKVDSCPTLEDIEKSQRLAKQLYSFGEKQ